MRYILIILIALLSINPIFAGDSDKPMAVKGKVVDQNNEPLAGVEVLIVETNTKVYTDLNGNFEVSSTQLQKYTIKITAISYKDLVLKAEPVKQSAPAVLIISYLSVKLFNFTWYDSGVGTPCCVESSTLTVAFKFPILEGLPISLNWSQDVIAKQPPNSNPANNAILFIFIAVVVIT